MKRIERIHAYIREKTNQLRRDDLCGRVGVEAAQIARELNILRNNVSMELNALHRQDKIIKLTGRPVLYLDKQAVEKLCGAKLAEGPLQVQLIEECAPVRPPEANDPFARLIGADKSLKKQVDQAKAAILYPPDGLHTLIVGQTGVGKTLFARMMYEYGKAMGKLGPAAPFVTFNCADYYNNAQLLISHIFGHIKGAFTGADSAKAGLVEEADQGILFLDEIHRLPPEGQEMIFYFIDTGSFNRLGETTRARRAKVLIIGATTEDPSSALTKTFVRRIPNIIAISPLIERSMEEKTTIVKMLLSDEVQRINKPVKISVESVQALIGSIGAGNVGQLKSNIKLLCAKAFLNGIDNPDYIEIDFKLLPAKIKMGLLTLSADRKELAKLSQYVAESLFISPSGEHRAALAQAEDEPFNLYQVVEDKIELLKGEGVGDELIKQIVASDVNVYIKSFYNKQDVRMSTRERLLKIVDKSVVDFAEEINLLVEHVSRGYSDRFLYAFSLHLSAFLKRRKENRKFPYGEFGGAVKRDSPAFKAALAIKDRIESHYRIEVPETEIEYFALLLESLEEDEKEEKVVVIVAAHGVSTASSMAEVAQKLCGANSANVVAVDMPLEISPQETLEKMIEQLETVHYQKGALLLADMGSLCNFGPMIMERLNIQVKTIDMVSTPLVIEAIRKADIVGTDLAGIYESLADFKGYETAAPEMDSGNGAAREVIVTICATGAGAAVKLRQLVENILASLTGRDVEVLPVGVKNLESELKSIAKERKILAAVGMARPKMDIPFIPLEKLIGGDGESLLRALVNPNFRFREKEKNVVVRSLCEESLQKFLTYLNPAKVISVLFEFDSVLESELNVKLTNPIRIRLVVHTGCALERMVTRSGLTYKGARKAIDPAKLEAVRNAARVFDRALSLALTEDELCYIAELI